MVRRIIRLYELDETVNRFVSPLSYGTSNDDCHIELAYPFSPRRLVIIRKYSSDDESYRCVHVESKPFCADGVEG
jgi:hypothetical protein